MIRVYTAEDEKIASEYLKKSPYGQAIQAILKEYGTTDMGMTAYIDVTEAGVCEGFYAFLYRNLVLYCEKNKVEVDFLEELFGIREPLLVAGRRDNVLVASWLLTEYSMREGQPAPALVDEEGRPVRCAEAMSLAGGDWAVLSA